MCRSESGSGWVIKPALFDTRSVSDTPVRALQQQLSQSVWFHCVSLWLPGALDLHHMYTCAVSPANNPLPHGVWSCPRSPLSRGGCLDEIMDRVVQPRVANLYPSQTKFPTLSRKKKRKITTLARISVACYLSMVEQQPEYRPTHNSNFRSGKACLWKFLRNAVNRESQRPR